MKVVSVAVVAMITGLLALTAAAGTTSSRGKDRTQLIPRVGINLIRCETKTKQLDCNTCEFNKCTDGNTVWTDDVMRCTDKDCSRHGRFDRDLELEEEEVHADFDFE